MSHTRADLRRAHPILYVLLYAWIAILAGGLVLLALNFWGSNPTFNPYGISKNFVGLVFFLLGVSQLFFLVVADDPEFGMVRLIMAASISVMFFWGASNTQQFFAGNASLQLPILYLIIAVLQVPTLIGLNSLINLYAEAKA